MNQIFAQVRNGDYAALSTDQPAEALRPFLPHLVHLATFSSPGSSASATDLDSFGVVLGSLLSRLPLADQVLEYMEVDHIQLVTEACERIHLNRKECGLPGSSAFPSAVPASEPTPTAMMDTSSDEPSNRGNTSTPNVATNRISTSSASANDSLQQQQPQKQQNKDKDKPAEEEHSQASGSTTVTSLSFDSASTEGRLRVLYLELATLCALAADHCATSTSTSFSTFAAADNTLLLAAVSSTARACPVLCAQVYARECALAVPCALLQSPAVLNGADLLCGALLALPAEACVRLVRLLASARPHQLRALLLQCVLGVERIRARLCLCRARTAACSCFIRAARAPPPADTTSTSAAAAATSNGNSTASASAIYRCWQCVRRNADAALTALVDLAPSVCASECVHLLRVRRLLPQTALTMALRDDDRTQSGFVCTALLQLVVGSDHEWLAAAFSSHSSANDPSDRPASDCAGLIEMRARFAALTAALLLGDENGLVPTTTPTTTPTASSAPTPTPTPTPTTTVSNPVATTASVLQTPTGVSLAVGLLRAYCALSGCIGVRLSSAECTSLLRLCALRVQPTLVEAGGRLACVALSTLLALEALLPHTSEAGLATAFEAIRQLSMASAQARDFVALMAAHLHANRTKEAVQELRSQLGLAVSVHVESLQAAQRIFCRVLPEARVARDALFLPPPPPPPPASPSSTTSSELGQPQQVSDSSVGCVYQLLCAGAFTRHRLDASQWVWRAVSLCTMPPHPLMPALLEQLVAHTLPDLPAEFCMRTIATDHLLASFPAHAAQLLVMEQEQAQEPAQEPQSPEQAQDKEEDKEEEHEDSFSRSDSMMTDADHDPATLSSRSPARSSTTAAHTPDSTPSAILSKRRRVMQALVLYYLLLLADRRQEKLMRCAVAAGEEAPSALQHLRHLRSLPNTHALELLGVLPIRALLTGVERHPHQFGTLAQPLLALAADHLPHLYTADSSLAAAFLPAQLQLSHPLRLALLPARPQHLLAELQALCCIDANADADSQRLDPQQASQRRATLISGLLALLGTLDQQEQQAQDADEHEESLSGLARAATSQSSALLASVATASEFTVSDSSGSIEVVLQALALLVRVVVPALVDATCKANPGLAYHAFSSHSSRSSSSSCSSSATGARTSHATSSTAVPDHRSQSAAVSSFPQPTPAPPHALEVTEQEALLLQKLWERSFPRAPWVLAHTAVNALSRVPGSVPLTHAQLTTDPLLVLGANGPRALCCAVGATVLLSALAAYLAASRRQLAVRAASVLPVHRHHFSVLASAQEAGIVQLLLQQVADFLPATWSSASSSLSSSSTPSSSSPSSSTPSSSSLSSLSSSSTTSATAVTEITSSASCFASATSSTAAVGSSGACLRGGRAAVFRFLHQFFIDRPGMLELIVHQGFPVHAVPAAVNGIPSLHVCLNYLPARLLPEAVFDLSGQVFAVHLVTHLMRRYPIPPSLQAGRVALGFLARMNPRLPDRALLLEHCLPCLPVMCSVFPELIVMATDILLRIQGQCVSSFERRMADVCDGHSRVASIFQGGDAATNVDRSTTRLHTNDSSDSTTVSASSSASSANGSLDVLSREEEDHDEGATHFEAASSLSAWDSSHPTAASLDRLRKLTLLTFRNIRADAVHMLAK